MYVSSALPVVAVLVAVGEPWVRVRVRVVVVSSFVTLAITHYSKRLLEGKDGDEAVVLGRKVPVPLCCALAIRFYVAARWAGYQHSLHRDDSLSV